MKDLYEETVVTPENYHAEAAQQAGDWIDEARANTKKDENDERDYFTSKHEPK